MKKQIDNTKLTYIDIKDIIDNKKSINLSKKTVNLISKAEHFWIVKSQTMIKLFMELTLVLVL